MSVSGVVRSASVLQPTSLDRHAVASLYRSHRLTPPARVELADCETIDSAGLALLTLWQRQAKAAGGALQIIDPPPRLAELERAHRSSISSKTTVD